MAVKNKYKFIRFIVVVAIFLYLIYYIFTSYFVKQDKTYIATYDQMYLENEYEGLIIRNEKNFYSDIPGEITYKINDGEVVKKGQVIAEIKESKNDTTEDIAVENASNEIKDISNIILNIECEIESIKLQIVKAANDNEVYQISELEEKLKLKLDLKDKLKNNKIKNYNMQEISQRDSGINSENYFYSNYSGIVSKKFDGLEKTLTMSNLYSIDYKNIYDEDINYVTKNSGLINKNDNVYRIVDNYSYYVAYIIPFDDIKLFKDIINEVNVNMDDVTYSASVYDCFENNSDGILLLEFNETFKDFYAIRRISSKIISDKFKGIKIFNDSIVTNNGVEGIYRVGIGFDTEFVPIKILNSSEKYSIIEENYFYTYENEKRKRVITAKINDQILRNGDMYKNGNDL
jgi:hypothetical protein